MRLRSCLTLPHRLLRLKIKGAEILYDDSTRFAERAQAAGVDVTLETWEDMLHVFHIYSAMIEEARDAIARIGRFAEKHLGA